MITVTFDGVEYTKATQVAKQFGYTADYLGQLCRAKKVNARLVGRSWFINIPSLEGHREKKYKKEPAENAEKTEPTETEKVNVKVISDDIPNKNYLRRVPSPDAPSRRFTQTEDADGVARYVSLRYEEDGHSLIPRVADRPKVTLLKVNLAGSESVPITTTDKGGSTLKPEPLPEVSLSGSLKVSEIKEEQATEEETSENKKNLETNRHSVSRDKSNNRLTITEVETLASEKLVKEEPDKVIAEESDSTSDSETHNVPVAVSFAEKVYAQARQNPVDSQTEHEIPVQGDAVVQTVSISYQLPVLGVLVGVIFGVLILSAEQVALATSEAVDFTLSFDWQNIANMALILFTG